MLITEQYRRLNADLHRRAMFGQRGNRHAVVVRELVDEFGPGSILDYGCGRATLAKALPELEVINYDPAIDEYSFPPKPAHLVVCTDVLEHVEPDCLDAVLRDLARVTITAAHLVIATLPDGRKRLADGRDPHLIVKPAAWWRDYLQPFMPARLVSVSSRDCTLRVVRQ